jgi:hypothetical protein
MAVDLMDSMHATLSLVMVGIGRPSTSFFAATKFVDGPPSRTMTIEFIAAR